MKPLLSAYTLALALTASAIPANAFTGSSVIPTLDFPEPPSEPVTKDENGIEQ